MEIDYSKATRLFDGVEREVTPDDISEIIQSFLAVEYIYLSATREISTKLEILNDEFKITMDRNPIQQIITRVKTPKDIIKKLIRKGYAIDIKSAREKLNDIGGVRIICSYIDDIYMIAQLLMAQDDIELLLKVDYIKNPKSNGYRSLHLVVTVPVFLSRCTERVKVEIQIRTIAMDFWASLEHDLVYKLAEGKTDKMVKELRDCADVIAQTDIRMQNLHKLITSMQD